MATANFRFNVDQKVTDCFDQTGIIEMCAIDDGTENKYFVKNKDGGQWYKESELKEI